MFQRLRRKNEVLFHFGSKGVDKRSALWDNQRWTSHTFFPRGNELPLREYEFSWEHLMLDANPTPLPLIGAEPLLTEISQNETEQATSGWTLQKLGERHKQAASLLAQGCKRGEIAAITQYSEEYISFLTRQPLFRAYVKEMGRYSEERLTALFDEVVDVIADTMRNGTEEGRLKAARMQMEATGRIGRERATRDEKPEDDSLNALADRLVQLMRRKHHAVLEGDYAEIEDAEELERAGAEHAEPGLQDNAQPSRSNPAAAALSSGDTGQQALTT